MQSVRAEAVVAEEKGKYVVVDGYHCQLLGRGRENKGGELKGSLPFSCVRPERKGQASRIAATIRHNRADGVV